MAYILEGTKKRRRYWIDEIAKISGNFGTDSERVQSEIEEEIKKGGNKVLLDHLRTCGALPESYEHDSSEEKLYSKYTDVVVAESFAAIGLKSAVIRERADSADVEVVANNFSFVADAKAFRLSRTAKNQKDFKVDAMHSWKRAHKYAVVVCPLYQLPSRASQIYLQATSRDVLIFSYSHLAAIVRISDSLGSKKAIELLHRVFKCVSEIHTSKDAIAFWTAINRQFLSFHKSVEQIYKQEREALVESIDFSKDEALNFLSAERKRILQLSHKEALKQLLEANNLDNRERIVKAIANNSLFGAT